MSQSQSSHYTFGDTDLAAQRLILLAEAFAPSSTGFLKQSRLTKVHLAVDMGSALGLTTRQLADITHADIVVGYERSTRYLALARARFPDLRFEEVDVLSPVFPHAEIDLVYARFLLTHLPDPGAMLQTCVKHLRVGGRLLLEETSNLSSPLPTLATYYGYVSELQAHHGQETYIGRRLPMIAESLSQVRVTSRSTPIAMPAKTMARLHAMNISTWKSDPFMLEQKGGENLDDLEQALREIAQTSSELPKGLCEMSQVIVEKKAAE